VIFQGLHVHSRPCSEQAVGSRADANRAVAQIGGWRADAKEASQAVAAGADQSGQRGAARTFQQPGSASDVGAELGLCGPFLSFDRMVAGDELELGRLLSFGLLDLLTLPQRQGVARRSIARAQLQLSADDDRPGTFLTLWGGAACSPW
jgi:hypothetical protein